MAVTIVGQWGRNTVTPAGATATLTLPTGWQLGDKAIIRVTCPTNITFVNFFGWSKIQDQVVTGAKRVGVFQKVLTTGDSDGVMTFSNVCAYTMEGFGVRAWDSSYTLVPSTTGSSSSASAIVAPSVATGYGVLVCFHTKQQSNDAGSGLNSWTPAAGMTILRSIVASSASGGSINVGPETMFEWEPRASGTSGTRSATSLYNGTALYPGAWVATSLFIRGLADTVVTVGKITETNTVKAVTAAFGPTTVKVGKITETNTVKDVINPLQSIWTSPPQVLKENPVTGSVLVWDATVPAGSSLIVETSVDNGASFQPGTQAKPVPGLINGLTVAKTVIARIIMNKTTVGSSTPVMRRLEFRVGLDASRNEFLPMGVFTLNDTDIIDTFDGLALELSGTDRSRTVSRNAWERTYILWENTNVVTAIKQIISNRRPGTQYNAVSSDATIPPGMFLGQDSGIDPMQDAQRIGRDAALEVFFDPYGLCTIQGEPDPDVQPSVWTFEDVYNPTIISLSRRVTDEDTYNRVVVIGEGTDLPAPVRGIWENLDPSDPTYILGNYREVTKVVRSSSIRDVTQAYEAARALGLRVKGATEILEADVIPNYALVAGDIVTVLRGKSGVEGLWILDSITKPCGADQLMHISARRQRLT